MQKTDLSKEHKHYYKARPTAELVTIDNAGFITTEGHGSPASTLFTGRVKALYNVAYILKKICKLQQQDFKVPGLEGYWWNMDGAPQEEWHWKLAIQLPAFVTMADFRQAVALASNKNPAHLDTLRLEQIPGSLAVQVLHVGAYDEEGPGIEKLHAYIQQHQLQVTGPHHEIYLNDPSRTVKEKLKTILRLNVRKK